MTTHHDQLEEALDDAGFVHDHGPLWVRSEIVAHGTVKHSMVMIVGVTADVHMIEDDSLQASQVAEMATNTLRDKLLERMIDVTAKLSQTRGLV